MRALTEAGFEERSIVIPRDGPAAGSGTPRPRRRRLPADDPTGAYLSALAALERDGRWTRRPAETPAAHLERARGAARRAGVRPAGGRLSADPLRRGCA